MVNLATLSAHDRALALLREENDLLRERVRQLEALVTVPAKDAERDEYMTAFGLTKVEANVLWFLMNRVQPTHEQIFSAVWGKYSTAVHEKIVPTIMHHVRAKIIPFDLAIELVWGQGYFIKPAIKDKLRAYIETWKSKGRIPRKNYDKLLISVGKIASHV